MTSSSSDSPSVASGVPSLPLRGQHALVTGAGTGIGAAIAHALASAGASVTLAGRRLAPLAAVASAMPPGVRSATVCFDVSDEAAVIRGITQARDGLGPVSILVNNAGQAASAPFGKTSLELWRRLLDVNLTGTFLCSREVLPDMLAAGRGRVINIASTAGQRGYAYVAAYAAAKHGVIGLTRSLALEVARKGVTVNAICPGYTETEILRESIANVVAKTGRTEEAARAEFTKSNPQGRLVQPSEVAATVLWLCSEAAGSITGQSVSIAGGEVM
jgi:NAD(P)-dependent dehydrogenase (short-subunit alcohol dehydrogenase family)